LSEIVENVNIKPTVAAYPELPAAHSRSYLATGFSRLLRRKLVLVALAIFSVITLLSYSAGWICQTIIKQDRDDIDLELLTSGFQPPVPPGTLRHLLGSDELGRDTLARLLYGGQVSLTVGFLVAAISITIGTALGLVAGYFGGKVDDFVNLLVQVILNVPALFLLILLSTYYQFNTFNLSVLIGLLAWPGLTRQVRGAVLSLRSRDYILAAKAIGVPEWRIILSHILPNVLSLMLVVVGFNVAIAIQVESALSFLGFGISVPIPSWGNMLADSQSRFTSAPWLVYAPALAIFVTVLCVFIIADGVRDAFDPQLKRL